MNFYLLFLLLGLITFGLRVSFIAFSDRLRLPKGLERALTFVPAAVLAAIVAPAFFYPEDTFDMSFDNAFLMAGVCAWLTAWRSKSTLLTVAVGMAALWGYRALIG
jgi:branched-subunit amino acid transport protein